MNNGDTLAIQVDPRGDESPTYMMNKNKFRLKDVKEHWLVLLFGLILPVVLFCAFVGYPIIYTIVMSFSNWNGLSLTTHFVGISNYDTLLHTGEFWRSLVNTVSWTIGSLLISNVIGLSLAILLQPKRVYLATLFRSILFLPVTMSLVSVGIMFAYILNPNFGIITTILHFIGVKEHVDLLGNPNTALITLILVFGWSYVGIPLMIYHAGLSQIGPELYEVAAIEGATRIAAFRYVTLPILKPIITVVTILSVIQGLKSFDLVAAITSGGPGNATDVLGFYMYIQAFEENYFGYGSAVSVVIMLLSLVFVVAYLRKIGGETLHGAD